MAPETATKNAEPLTAEQAPWTYWMETATHFAHFPLRLALVAVFTYKFITKFQGIEAFAEMAAIPVFAAVLVALAEVAIVVLVIAGAIDHLPMADRMTRSAGLITVFIMIGAIGLMHWPEWAFTNGGMEYNVVLIMIGLYLAMRGNRI